MEFFYFFSFFSSGVTFGISNCVITITLPFSRCCLFCFLSSGVSYIMFVHPSIHPSIHIHQFLMGERIDGIWIGIGIHHTSGFPSSCII
ncbi:hypothetical protein BDQ94DRAFT_83434 [Aspergillus welwitschiae]|uniref:Uncharacterized protein n=1 Tax=Aspergillus welwitschiae TaxID=1341132 RepID=A0A3F3PRF7_9EURO|nr:hypothetical protein BDQ94DRAFT_83434 [Aspergillus welwitschiae]RDH29484.1 hypothetical protein BDQ94DRAFT_83434 [Aspergillus welwitschiae]